MTSPYVTFILIINNNKYSKRASFIYFSQGMDCTAVPEQQAKIHSEPLVFSHQPDNSIPLPAESCSSKVNNVPPITPAFYQSDSGIPIFSPTWPQFQDFQGFLTAIHSYGERSGLVKVIPPVEWTEQLPSPTQHIHNITIRHPIEQKFDGAAGTWRQWNIETRKSYSVDTFQELSQSPKYGMPKPLRSGRRCESCTACQGVVGNLRQQKEKIWLKWSEMAESSVEDDKVSVGQRKVIRWKDMFPHYSTTYYKQVERDYWRNVSFNSPLYGADFEGSLMDDKVTCWNFQSLPGLLQKMVQHVPGINRPYLYFGMWKGRFCFFSTTSQLTPFKATFAWHVEDMDLYSINYIHFGAAKQWYVIPPNSKERFERLMQST
jgi:hypothetical protein